MYWVILTMAAGSYGYAVAVSGGAVLPGSFFRSPSAYGVDEAYRVDLFGFFECACGVAQRFGGFQVFSGLGPFVGSLPKKFFFFSDAHGFAGLGRGNYDQAGLGFRLCGRRIKE